MLIYKATCLVTGKSYIGLTKLSLKERARHHNKSKDGMYFHSAIQKYGKGSFMWVELARANSLQELNELEKFYIKTHKTLVPYGYNLHTGGDAHECTIETRKKMSAARLGKHFSPATEIKPGQRISIETEFKKGQRPLNSLQVIDLYSGIIFETVKEAAESIGIKPGTLHHRLRYGKKEVRYQIYE